MRLGRLLAVVCVMVAAWALAAPEIGRWRRAGQLLGELASADPGGDRVHTENVEIPGRLGPIRGRVYRLSGSRGPGVVVAHGVHYQGIDERRLVPFARALARSGRVVLTPELPDVTDYRITPDTIDQLVDAVRYLGNRRDLVFSERVGLLGFSFAGGLSLVAASRPAVAEQLEFVASIGGHHDLERVLRFFVTNEIDTPTGRRPFEAHEYGLLVFAYGHVDRLVPAKDRRVLREALRAWLQEDRPRAVAIASGRTTEAGDRLFRLVETGRLSELADVAERVIAERTVELEALSPRGKLAHIRAPVLLLHGSRDSVIPASEVDWAKLEGARQMHTLVSRLLNHVEVDGEASWLEKFQLLRFMTGVV